MILVRGVRVLYLILWVYRDTLYYPGEGTLPHSLSIQEHTVWSWWGYNTPFSEYNGAHCMILVRVQYLILWVYWGTLYDPGEGTIPHSLSILYHTVLSWWGYNTSFSEYTGAHCMILVTGVLGMNSFFFLSSGQISSMMRAERRPCINYYTINLPTGGIL